MEIVDNGRSKSASELFFQFRTSSTENVKLIEIFSEKTQISRLKLVGQNSLVFEWLSFGDYKSVMVTANYSLSRGLWHSVILERNFVEVMLVLDTMFVASAPETDYRDVLNISLVFQGGQVRVLISGMSGGK